MMGFIVVGWPEKRKNKGAIGPGDCPHCGNRSDWYLEKSRQWAEVFWVPVVPLEKATYYVVCDTCGLGVELETDTEIQQAKRLIDRANEFVAGEMPQTEYLNDVEDFWITVSEGEPLDADQQTAD